MTHPHQPCGRGGGGSVLTDFRRPAADVQTSAGVAGQSGHLWRRVELVDVQVICGKVRRREKCSYLPGDELECVLLEGLHLVEPGSDDLL